MSHHISRRGGSNFSSTGGRGSLGGDESRNNTPTLSNPPSVAQDDETLDPHISDIDVEDEHVAEDVIRETETPLHIPVLPSQGGQHQHQKIHITEANPSQNGSFMPQEVVCKVTDIIRHRLTGPWLTYSEIPKQIQNAMWSDFINECSWDDYMEIMVKKTFIKKVKVCMSDWFSTARRLGNKPGWLGEDIWKEMLQKWEADEKFQKFSARGKKNRSSNAQGLGHAIHTQGRHSVGTLRKKLTTTSGELPSRSAMFERAHIKKGTTDFVNKRAKNTIVAYNMAMEERQAKAVEEAAASNSEPTPIDPDVVWLETVGERNGRVYGMGNEVANIKKKQLSTFSTAHSSSTGISTQEEHDLRYRVQELSVIVNVMQSTIVTMKTDMKELFYESLKDIQGEMSRSTKKRKSKKKKRRVDESPESSSDEDEE